MTDYSLYVIIDQEWIKERDPVRLTKDILSNGATLLQYRNKSGSGSQFYHNARLIHDVSVEYNIPLIINDRVDIAMAIRAEGVHLGQEDLPITKARMLAGSDLLIGLSVSHLEELSDIGDADYLGVGAMFTTQTKPEAEYGGLRLMKQIRKRCDMPLVGIGGININNADKVLRAGADGVAVISAVLGHKSPAAATQLMWQRIQKTKKELFNASVI
ncbi:thiamine phosphate synthase [bacterium]|nr:thiamine phosphate synthase [bacterium]